MRTTSQRQWNRNPSWKYGFYDATQFDIDTDPEVLCILDEETKIVGNKKPVPANKILEKKDIDISIFMVKHKSALAFIMKQLHLIQEQASLKENIANKSFETKNLSKKFVDVKNDL